MGVLQRAIAGVVHHSGMPNGPKFASPQNAKAYSEHRQPAAIHYDVEQRIFGNVSLRPTRLAFFVSPRHPSHLQRALEINTCLWGGMGNPILPLKEGLNRRHFKPAEPPTETDIIDSYIRNLEPEVLVVSDLSTFPNIPTTRDRQIVAIDDLYKWIGENRPRVGISMFHVYQFLWQDSFRFEHRVKTRFVTARLPLDWPLFVAATWGTLPSSMGQSNFAGWYEQVVSPEQQSFTAESFVSSYQNEWRDPLSLTLSHARFMGQNESYIMLIRPDNPLDVMAFWTLRAIGNEVIPVPLQWRDAMLPFIKQIIANNTIPHKSYVTICRGPGRPSARYASTRMMYQAPRRPHSRHSGILVSGLVTNRTLTTQDRGLNQILHK